MENITIDNLMKILDKKLNKLIPFTRKFDVFLQKKGAGCYDVEKWAVFVPDSFDNRMRIHVILHEGAHLVLREKLSGLISPKKFDRLKWSMEPFFIENSIFSLDEAFAEIVATTIISELPEKFFEREIVFNKSSKPSYEDEDKKLDIFLAKISEWKIPITLKNSNLNISNTLNNLTFLEPKKRIKAIINSFSILENENYKNFIAKIIKDPLKNSPNIKLSFNILPSNVKIDKSLKELDTQIFLDYLEILSWVSYTENYHVYSGFVNKKNLNKPKKQTSFNLSKKFKKKLSKISKNLEKIRREIMLAWKSKDRPRLKKLINSYNSQRWVYREKIDLKNTFNKFGFGRFKWE